MPDLNPQNPTPLDEDVALPGLDLSVDQMATALEAKVAALTSVIDEKVAARSDASTKAAAAIVKITAEAKVTRRTLSDEINAARSERTKAERLLNATKPRAAKGGAK